MVLMDILYSDPQMVKTTKSAIVRTAGKIFKNKKKVPQGNIILHHCAYLWANIPHSLCMKGGYYFFCLKNWQFSAFEMAQGSNTQNSKIGDLDHPWYTYILILDEISECKNP